MLWLNTVPCHRFYGPADLRFNKLDNFIIIQKYDMVYIFEYQNVKIQEHVDMFLELT